MAVAGNGELVLRVVQLLQAFNGHRVKVACACVKP